ncbi:cytochrome c biogenesis protein [Virgibacillus halotolerans]|uniref:cytochrome c biogenesis protein ResB n=1 Tax=Virgibacillus halotolerans TaxID=1071053 RepID=UPI00195FD4CD|nr:cytochrome c biogenesis protein ResB [Virgibacillus halotolerans]MBM7598324.1 cytochrome c biogenesis protein [Virgibacillus halotolerans]
MNKIKCECGHVNPEGTVLCEACGKPIEGNQHIEGNDKKKLLNMRYDGSARRSLTYRKSPIDKIWAFFSSVKVGIWLIVLTLIASAVGSILPQEMYIPADAPSRDPAVFYEDRYGIFGLIFYQLGFHNLYSSWWYMILIALIGVSLVICSIDRYVPLRRALKMQKAKRHETFINRQRLYSETEEAVTDEDIEKVKENLRSQRYKIRDEDGHILAEKGRFSRWGPYVNHIGLIIILLAALLRMTPLFYLDDYVWVREGEQIVIPGTDGEYYIKNKKFTLETYDESDEKFQASLDKQGEEIAKNYQTDVVVYQAQETVPGAEPKLDKILEDDIRMNHPIKFGGFTLYQAGYQLDEFTDMSFKIYNTADDDEKELDAFTIDLSSPEPEYKLDNGFKVVVDQYYPDYVLEDGEPRSETKYPRNPAFVLFIYPPDSDEAEVSFIGIGKNIDATGENKYKVGIQDFNMHDVSGLTVRRDYTLPFFGVGAAIFMIGVIQGMYWQHRRIWIHPKGKGVLLGAHTNKNWFGVSKDIEKAISGTTIKMVDDQQELNK